MDFSASPLSVLALDYGVVALSWGIPTGDYDWFRVVRNQSHFPENQEDGVVLVDDTSVSANYNTFIDGQTPSFQSVSLSQGSFAHYSIWVRKSGDGSWVEAARNYCLIPKDHGDTFSYNQSTYSDNTTHQKVLELIPKIFTSSTLSPLDEVDENSTLYRFLQAFSFTVDEMLTYADLAVPGIDISVTAPSMLATRLHHYGIYFADNLPSASYRALIRDAIYMYSNKGTTTGILTLIENLSGFNTTITSSPNLMPSIDSATFNDGNVGGWTATNCSIAYDSSTDVPTTEMYSQGTSGRGLVTVSSTGAYISLGSTPFVNSFPVSPGYGYNLSFYVKASASRTVTPVIKLYDTMGNLVTTFTSSAKTVGTSWTKVISDTVVAPLWTSALANSYTNTTVGSQTSYVFNMPNGHLFKVGDVVYLSNVPAGNGRYSVTASSGFSLTVLGGSATTNSTGPVSCYIDIQTASMVAYGLISVQFANLASYYLDLFQISQVATSNVIAATVTGSSGDQAIKFTTDVYDSYGQIQVGDLVNVTGVTDSGGASTGRFNVVNASVISKTGNTITVNATGFSQTYVNGGVVSLFKSYHEPNGIYAYMAPNKVNYIKNPSFETTPAASGSKNYWNFTNAGTSTLVSDSPTFVLRDYSCRITPAYGAALNMNTSTDSGIIPPGQWYTFSIYLKTTSATPATNLDLYMTAIDSTLSLTFNSASSTTVPITGATVSGTSGTGKTVTFIANNSFTAGQTVRTTGVVDSGGGSHFNFTSAIITAATSTTFTISGVTGFAQTYVSGGFATSNFLVLSSDWTRYSTSLYLPYDYNGTPLSILGTQITVGIRSYYLNAATTILVDGAQLEVGFVATDYFDGSYSAIGGAWLDNTLPDRSSSYLYINKPVKIKALADIIPDFIPRNVPYAVTTAAGVEVKGIA